MLYLTQIEIEKDHQERGFGTATLAMLTQLHKRSILPVREREVFRLLGKNAQL